MLRIGTSATCIRDVEECFSDKLRLKMPLTQVLKSQNNML